MRLMFENELNFLKEELGLELPLNSVFMDKMGIKVLDENGEYHIIARVKAKDMKLTLAKDKTDMLNNMKIKTYQDLINEREDHLLKLEQDSIEIINKYIKEYEGYIPYIPVSGGKDSAVTHYLVKSIIPNAKVVFSNTSNETHHTYIYKRKLSGCYKDKSR